MINEELLKKCHNDFEKETALFFDKIGLKCLGLSLKINREDDKGEYGEIDGIFVDEESELIIIYEDSALKNPSQKIEQFFSNTQKEEWKKQIFSNQNIPDYEFISVFIDKSRKREKSRYNKDKDKYKILFLDDFDYFNNQAKILKTWTKNDLYNFLDIPISSDGMDINAIQIYINDKPAYVFADKPSELIKYTYVSRRRGNDHGYQRDINSRHVQEISQYLRDNNFNAFPNSILLNCTEEISIHGNCHSRNECPKPIKITIPKKYSSCRIIDGQHRILSFSQMTKTDQTKYSLPVVLLDNMPKDKEINLFLDINDKAKKVEANLKYDLTLELKFDEGDKRYLIKQAVKLCNNLDGNVPNFLIFRGRIGQKRTKPYVTLKSFVDSIVKNKLIDFDNKGLLQEGSSKDYDIKNPTKHIKDFLIEISKQKSNIDYLLSNRGIDAMCQSMAYILSKRNQDKIINYADKFINSVTENIDELKKYQGAQGKKDAINLIIETMKI